MPARWTSSGVGAGDMSVRLKRREALKLLGSITGLGILTACSSSTPAPAPAESKPADAKPAQSQPAAPAAQAQPTAKPAEAKPAEAKPAAQIAPAAGGAVFEIQHWHTLTASDGEVWTQQIENFNTAMKEQKLPTPPKFTPP